MNQLIVLFVLVAGLFSQQTTGAPVEEKQLQACLNNLDIDTKLMAVPESVSRLGTSLMSLNRNLVQTSLANLLNEDRVEYDVVDKGFFTDVAQLQDDCVALSKKVISRIQSTDCGESFMAYVSPFSGNFETVMKGHENIADLIAHTSACATLAEKNII